MPRPPHPIPALALVLGATLLAGCAASTNGPTDEAGATGAVTAVAFAPDSRTLASLGEDRAVRLWDVATRQPTKVVPLRVERAEYPRQVRLGPGGGLSVVLHRKDGAGRRATVWDIDRDRRTPYTSFGPGGVALSPNGDLWATEDGVWRALTGEQVWPADLPRGVVSRVGFSPGGQVVWFWVCDSAAQDMSLIYLAEARFGRKVLQVGRIDDDRLGRFLSAPVLSPDSRSVAFVGPGRQSVHLWDVLAGREVWVRQVADRPEVEVVGFTPGGKALVAWGRGAGRLSVRDAATGEESQAVNIEPGAQLVELSPDGTTVAVAKGSRVTFRRLGE